MKQRIGFFVTGTDTEVGKTLVSAALILKLRESGFNTAGFKPVVAGTYQDAAGKTLNEDLETLRIASNLLPGELSLCPYVLDQAVAPHIAAQAHAIDLNGGLIQDAFEQISSQSVSYTHLTLPTIYSV